MYRKELLAKIGLPQISVEEQRKAREAADPDVAKRVNETLRKVGR
jgi:hypothetical protein